MHEPNRTTVNVLWEIGAERERQMAAEGWTPEHDDTHSSGEMAKAASCYAYFAASHDTVREIEAINKRNSEAAGLVHVPDVVNVRRAWRWDWRWWKPKDRRRDLVRAAALIVAEIERLDRTQMKQTA